MYKFNVKRATHPFHRYYLHTYANNCKDPSALRPSFLGSGLLTAGVTGAVVAFPEQSVTYIGYLASALVLT